MVLLFSTQYFEITIKSASRSIFTIKKKGASDIRKLDIHWHLSLFYLFKNA
jgi:hypothetical protein